MTNTRYMSEIQYTQLMRKTLKKSKEYSLTVQQAHSSERLRHKKEPPQPARKVELHMKQVDTIIQKAVSAYTLFLKVQQ